MTKQARRARRIAIPRALLTVEHLTGVIYSQPIKTPDESNYNEAQRLARAVLRALGLGAK